MCNQLFGKVEATKPTASRNASAEIFLVCQKYKAPETVDPKLLDGRHVLQDFGTSGKIRGPIVMQKKQPKKLQRRFRQGYEEDASTTFKSTTVLDFIKAQDPVEVLGLYTQFHFDSKEDENDHDLELVTNHPKTTSMIKEACQDLLVLGKKEFKKLLKWQTIMVKELKKEAKSEEPLPTENQEVDPETRMMKELAEIQDRLHQKAKKKEKKLREMKKHAKQRLAQFQQSEGITDQLMDDELFSLDHLPPSMEDLVPEDVLSSDDESLHEETDLDQEALDESYLEESYQRFLKRKGEEMEETPSLKRRMRLDDPSGEIPDPDVEVEEEESQEDEVPQTEAQMITNQWFDQEVFRELDQEDQPRESPNKPQNTNKEEIASQDEDFEIVKKQKIDSGTDTEDEFRLLDLDGKSEILAMARKLTQRKEKENLIDAAYSRFVFHDKGLPKWFEHDNDVYNRPQRMVTREEIEAEKELVRAMNARPIKKIAEAKSRKTKRLAQRMKQAMKRAEGISNQEELSHGTKMRQITRMMNQAKKKENSRFVSKDKFKKFGRGKQLKIQNRMPRLDKRLKSDKRQRGLGRGGKNSKTIKQKRTLAKQRYKQKHGNK